MKSLNNSSKGLSKERTIPMKRTVHSFKKPENLWKNRNKTMEDKKMINLQQEVELRLLES